MTPMNSDEEASQKIESSSLQEPRSTSGLLWAILIPSLPGRAEKLERLLQSLREQIVCAQLSENVSVITYTTEPHSQGGLTVGSKRNVLLSSAGGIAHLNGDPLTVFETGMHASHVSFIDDDDTIAPDYVSSIWEALQSNPDLIVFDVMVYGHPGCPKPCRYRLEYGKDFNERDRYCRLPNHLMVWRHALCLDFEDRGFGEDGRWAKAMFDEYGDPQKGMLYKMSVVEIEKVLYEYRYDHSNSASVGNAK